MPEFTFHLSTATLKPASHCQVAWQLGVVPAEPGAGEERVLKNNGAETKAAELCDKFKQAGTAADLEFIGGALWQCLAGKDSPAGKAWLKAEKAARLAAIAAKDDSLFLRTCIDLTDVGEDWQRLPWQTLYDGSRWLMQNPKQPFACSRTPEPGVLAEGWPWRILIVCGEALVPAAGGAAADDIAVGEELAAIEDGLWEHRDEIVLHVLDRPTTEELHQELRDFQPHVFHFIGHGNVDFLEIHNPVQRWRWTRGQIDAAFNNGLSPLPRLVFLNACHSEGGVPLEEAVFSGLTQLFLILGVPAVVGMADAVKGSTSLTVARSFYAQLMQGRTLDCALAQAAAEVNAQSDNGPTREAFLACLTVTGPPAQMLRWPVLSDAVRGQFKHPDIDRLNGHFVQRNLERGDFFLNIIGKTNADQPARSGVIAVHGDTLMGKTDTTCMVLKAMHARGWTVRRHTLPTDGPNWLAILRLIRHGQGNAHPSILDEALSDGPLPPAPAGAANTIFADFDKRLREGLTDPAAVEMEAVCEALIKALQALAAERPVVIALDALTTPNDGTPDKTPEWLKVLGEHFFGKLANGIAHPIFVVFILSADTAAEMLPRLDQALGHTLGRVPIAHFKPSEAGRALRQYFRKRLSVVASDYFLPGFEPEIRALSREFIELMATKRANNLAPNNLEVMFNNLMATLSLANLAKEWRP